MALIIVVLFSTSSFIISALILTFEYTVTSTEDYLVSVSIFGKNYTNLYIGMIVL